jgi:hypothetical protein
MDGFDDVRRFGMLRRKQFAVAASRQRDFVSSVEVRGATLQAVLLMSCDVAACLLVMLLSTPNGPAWITSTAGLTLYIEVCWSVQNWGSRWFQDVPDKSIPYQEFALWFSVGRSLSHVRTFSAEEGDPPFQRQRSRSPAEPQDSPLSVRREA